MNQSHPYNELLNKSKAIKEPDDSSQGLNFSLLDLGNTSNPHPGHGPMLAQQAAASPVAGAIAAAPLVVGVATSLRPTTGAHKAAQPRIRLAIPN